ncbi:MAG TPA: iron ABC transporter permease [Candidatus Bathyarchaeia archaeon]|nr:iron ABC transporter permease [Candidatus Bathyarchaeia archaeon]
MIFFLSLFVGAYHIPPWQIVEIIFDKIASPHLSFTEQSILFDIRIPRIILALITGCALSVASACFQGAFRNPLVSEYILGVSAGAAFGASLSIAFLGGLFPVQPAAFLGAVIAVIMTYYIAKVKGETSTISLVLAGIITTAVFTGGSYIIRYFAEPERLHVLIVWLMGSFANASWDDVIQSAPIVIAGTTLLFILRWRLNILSMGDEDAKTLGMDVEKMRLVFIGTSSLVTAATVCLVGIIGWVGLMVPHIVRMLIGSDNRKVIPVSAALGATLMVAADNLVRMSSGIELPVGVLTTMVGAPFFAYLVRKNKGSLWG